MRFIKKLFTAIIIIGIICLAAVLGINAYMKASVKGQIITREQAAGYDADCILVLGAGVRGSRPSDMLADRLKQAIAVRDTGGSRILLMSGDHGRKEYDEVNVMLDYAAAAGVPESDIFTDHAGFSTYDSVYRAKAVFGAEKVIIVTQGYHLHRALYIAKALGLEAVGVSADLRSYVGQSYRELREMLARIKDFAMTIIAPPPTYLGEAISLAGSAEASRG